MPLVRYKIMLCKYNTGFFSILTLLLAVCPMLLADPLAAGYAVYADSLMAGAGSDVPVRFYLTNEQPLASLSVPIAYDPSKVTLKSISFTGSRAQHIVNKIVTPANLSAANGHFLVAMFQWLEDPIAAGDGLLFTALFGVNPQTPVGSVVVLDTLFYAPGGTLEVVRVDTPGGIRPEFRVGKIVVAGPNRAPIFVSWSDQYLLEGDSLVLTIRANDPNGDRLTLAATSKPTKATFVDNGDGTARFAWVPDYVGPQSADVSPVKVRFWASDGDLSSQMEIAVHVINRNRAPEITAPGALTVEAGETLDFTLSAVDPDFESVSWSWSGLPQGATMADDNPARLTWPSAVTDTGSFVMRFVAGDPQGLADTALVTTSVHAVALFTLTLGSVQAFPNEDVAFDVILDNKLPVAGFNLLINYDPSALTFLSLSNLGTRTESFEYFWIEKNHNSIPGNVRIIGIANMGGGTPSLAPGDGAIARTRVHTSGNLDFAGQSIPLRFEFLDAPVNDDNTLTDSIGGRIDQPEIVFVMGSVLIHDIGQIHVGDINLNNLVAEIGDVIYFTNFFIHPALYRFSALQYANSDINNDHIAASVSDLVALINWVVSGIRPFGKMAGDETLQATVTTEKREDRTVFAYDSPAEVGAVYLVFETSETVYPEMLIAPDNGMTLDYRQDGREVKALLYSLKGATMPAGAEEILSVAGVGDVRITRVELGSADGRMIQAELTAAGTELPTNYELMPNYPNPFNPETTIGFALPASSQVELTIYNVLGQQVVTLIHDEYPAGVHQVIWSGMDGEGRAVASGVYLYRLTAAGNVMTRKMMLLK
jgi:hypothetical protein